MYILNRKPELQKNAMMCHFRGEKSEKDAKIACVRGGGGFEQCPKEQILFFFSVTSSLGHEITILFYSSYLTVPVISSARI